jgi:hypothetical protein
MRAVLLCRRAACGVLHSNSVHLLARTLLRVPATLPMTAFRTLVSAVAEAADPTKITLRTVLVKVGTGEYSPLELPIDNMNRTAILDALATSRIFANDLKDVPLGQVKVWVLPGAVGSEPTPDEEKAAKVLKGSETIADIIKGADKKGIDNVSKLVLRVSLPESGMSSHQASSVPLLFFRCKLTGATPINRCIADTEETNNFSVRKIACTC